MEPHTRAYRRGRFGDHFRRTAIEPPPAANEREWGYIPFTTGDTRMVRHQSLLDLGEFGADPEGIGEFLARERPRHVYYSAARYAEPGADTMDAKGWRSADLVFDLDADHLPAVDPAETSYPEMLDACKQALFRLLSFLGDDFGFSDLDVVFSGGRGYHVHVRDERVTGLGREERREIVDYLIGDGVDVDSVVETETVAGVGLKNPTDKWLLNPNGGWSKRVHNRLLTLLDELRQLDDADALARLREFDGIGEKSARTILGAVRNNYEQLRVGNVDAGGTGTRKLARVLCEETVAADHAPIDEPVTTDINRLIRLPGSLHGGTALCVTRIDRDELESFDPLGDTIPDTFRGQEIVVDVTDPGPVELDGDTFTVQEGETSVPEYVGAFLMARGRAEKGKESG